VFLIERRDERGDLPLLPVHHPSQSACENPSPALVLSAVIRSIA
jgi:hypothetical protein